METLGSASMCLYSNYCSVSIVVDRACSQVSTFSTIHHTGDEVFNFMDSIPPEHYNGDYYVFIFLAEDIQDASGCLFYTAFILHFQRNSAESAQLVRPTIIHRWMKSSYASWRSCRIMRVKLCFHFTDPLRTDHLL